MGARPFLGVCYYPEQWPEAMWSRDAARMASLGLKEVRIGEFAWSRIEPDPGRFEWDWLDRAIAVLGEAGLDVMLGTPTATPPKWLIDLYPDILAWDEQNQPRRFGSRRHYCFSSESYRREAARIVEALAKRYATNPTVVAWQTDNEYGCHGTVRSYSPAAARAFRIWLQARYRDVASLNAAWGTAFWSQIYRSFDEIDPPNQTVTEPNPSHLLDFYRFSSEQVVRFNRLQTDIIRKFAPGRTIVHNYMGFFFDFDHFAVSNDLDAVGWDSYPIGFLDVGPFSAEDKSRYMRQGHPDIAAFHHDLYRACGRGRWRVLEQQPGPVNWAKHNPAPSPGMVRLWSLEAFAHGAEAVNYFRWRQAPFAQEQAHAGLLRPDSAPAPGFGEALQTGADLRALNCSADGAKAEVAIIFSYDACWLFEAHPQGGEWRYPAIVFEWYAVLRRLGLNVDFLSPDMPLEGYKIVLAPSLPVIDPSFVEKVARSDAQILFGPRTGSKTSSLTIPDNLPPGPLQPLLPLQVTHCESFPAFHFLDGEFDGVKVQARGWLDHVETALPPRASSGEGGLFYAAGRVHYLTTLPNGEFLSAVIVSLARRAGVDLTPLPQDLRMRRVGDLVFVFNYGPQAIPVPDGIIPAGARMILGSRVLDPAGVAVWRAP
jgi:beta-galactosidase